MTILALPDLSNPSQGYNPTDNPIIYGFRWTHWSSIHQFQTVEDVLNYHNEHIEVIDVTSNSAPSLIVYFVGAALSKAEVFLRYMKNDKVITESITFHNPLEIDPNNSSLRRITGIRFATRNLGDGRPFFDFSNLAGEGPYECLIKATDIGGNFLTVRIPFQFTNLIQQPPEPGQGDEDEETPGVEEPPSGGTQGNTVKEEYTLTIIEGVSPFTKRPSTHYRPAAVGVLKGITCVQRVPTPSSHHISNPTDKPIEGIPYIPPPCDFRVTPTQVTGYRGDIVEFYFTHGNDSGVLEIVADYDPSIVEQLEDNVFRLKGEGTTEISFIVTYLDGQQCEAVSKVNVQVLFACDFSVYPSGGVDTVPVHQSITFEIDHGRNIDPDSNRAVRIEREYDTTKMLRNGDTYTGLEAGSFPIKYTAYYSDSDVCVETVVANFEALPCGTTTEGGRGPADHTYNLGSKPGWVEIHYRFFALPDKMEVFDSRGNLVASTNGEKVREEGSPLRFYYEPEMGNIRVIMNDGIEGSRWEYTIGCPE